MKISELKMDFGYNGKGTATAWVTLYSLDDVVEMIEWLRMVKTNMERWEKINATETPKK